MQQAYERLDEDLTSLMKDAHIFDEGCVRYVFYTRVVQHVPHNIKRKFKEGFKRAYATI